MGLSGIDLGFPNQYVSDSPCWLDGGQHGWVSLILWIFASVSCPRSRAGCPAIRRPNSLELRSAQHRLDATGQGYRQRCSGPDGRSQAEGGFGRSRGLAVAADQGRRFHDTRARCRACRTWLEGRLPLGVGLRACREAQFQKKAWRLANAIDPRSRGGGPSGQNIKVASKLSDWSSSTRPGPEPIWRPCGDGHRVAAGFTPRFPTVAGRP